MSEHNSVKVIKDVQSKMERFKEMFTFTGFMLAAGAGIAYLILLYIIIAGFEVSIDSTKLLMFLALGAIDGVVISLSMRIQGIDFAKAEKTSKKVLDEYNELITEDNEKFLLPLWAYMIINTIKDIIFKGGTVVFTLYFSITIMIEGIGDFKYFWLGAVNVIMYLGFGFLSLAKSYDHYLEVQIPLIKQKIKELKRKGDTNELLSANGGVSESSVSGE